MNAQNVVHAAHVENLFHRSAEGADGEFRVPRLARPAQPGKRRASRRSKCSRAPPRSAATLGCASRAARSALSSSSAASPSARPRTLTTHHPDLVSCVSWIISISAFGSQRGRRIVIRFQSPARRYSRSRMICRTRCTPNPPALRSSRRASRCGSGAVKGSNGRPRSAILHEHSVLDQLQTNVHRILHSCASSMPHRIGEQLFQDQVQVELHLIAERMLTAEPRCFRRQALELSHTPMEDKFRYRSELPDCATLVLEIQPHPVINAAPLDTIYQIHADHRTDRRYELGVFGPVLPSDQPGNQAPPRRPSQRAQRDGLGGFRRSGASAECGRLGATGSDDGVGGPPGGIGRRRFHRALHQHHAQTCGLHHGRRADSASAYRRRHRRRDRAGRPKTGGPSRHAFHHGRGFLRRPPPGSLRY